MELPHPGLSYATGIACQRYSTPFCRRRRIAGRVLLFHHALEAIRGEEAGGVDGKSGSTAETEGKERM